MPGAAGSETPAAPGPAAHPLLLGGRAVLQGLFIAILAEMAILVLYLVNLGLWPAVPWAVPLAAGFMVLLWRGLSGRALPPPEGTARQLRLRSRALPAWAWFWALTAIGAFLAGLVALAGWSSSGPAAAPAALLPRLPFTELGEHGFTLAAIFVTNYLLFAPLVEEAAFRGYMQVPLEKGFGPWVALPVVAVVFALLHFDRGAPLAYLGVALFFGLLAWRADSIWPGVIAHAAVNVWALFPGWRPGEDWLPASRPGLAATVAGCALVAAGALLGLGRAVESDR